MSDERPDPDQLLRRVQEEERQRGRGTLTIFLGAAPGVGKTYAMLLEAGVERDVEDRDVVAGIVETHGRFETTTLLAQFERLPRRKLEYRGKELEEFDIDGALARKPSLLLVDELAHTNVEGSRHRKRWQDVKELLDAGIDVMTTLNVQHLESLNDVVAQITGVIVRETVPDSVLDEADNVKLIDLPPDELLERMREGKVYLPAQAARAIEGFFKKGNLIALRELALRATAERVDAEMLEWRREHGIERTWAASDRLLVCIGPSPFSANLLRVARRMAAGLRARWYAVNVETPATMRLDAAGRARMAENLRLAQALGAETVTLTGENAAEEILEFARDQNVTKIVAGKPRIRSWRDRVSRGFLDELILKSQDIDIYVTVGDTDKAARTPARASSAQRPPAMSVMEYAAGPLMTAIATGVGYFLFGREDLADVAMTYLFGVVLVSMRFSFRVSVATAVLSVLCFDFVFIPPFLTFSVSDLRHTVTFGVMLLVAVVIAGLTQRVKDRAAGARKSERRTALLYAMSRELSQAQTADAVIRAACGHIEEVFDARTAVFTREPAGEIVTRRASEGFDAPLDKELGIVRWAWSNRREAGLGTETLPGGQGLYLPLTTSLGEPRTLGVLGIYPRDPERFADPDQHRLAEALGAQLAMAMERALFADETQRARLAMEAEQLRSTLLSSVSHDLRTPLAVMKGTVSTLVDDDATLAPDTRQELLCTLLEETEGLERLVRNLLDMTRLESGAVRVRKEWHSIEEVVGGALNRVESRLGGREVKTSVPGDMLAPLDPVLIEQVLINLLENAAKHTPNGTLIEVNALRMGEAVLIEVADRGPGLPPGEEKRVFEKFHRARSERVTAGVGLGLAICEAIARAHGGHISAENRDGGGAAFILSLPLDAPPPSTHAPEIDEPPLPTPADTSTRPE